jgi:two-component system sensor histidine kinase ResE
MVRTIVGKLWITIIVLVAVVISTLGLFLLRYIDVEYGDMSTDIKHLFFWTSCIGFFLTTFFAFFLMSKITQPLRNLTHAVNAIAEGDYRNRVDVASRDEIGELAEAFNRMAEQLDATIRDLTYEKEHMSSILRSMTDAVVTFGTSGQIVSTNPHGEQLLRMWARGVGAVAQAHVMDAWMPADIQQMYVTASTEDRELVMRLHVGQQAWSVVMDPLYAHGQRIGVVTVLRDATEEARLDKLRNDFVANVSHELRTPIALIQGYSEALQDDIASGAHQRMELVDIIHSEATRMGRLVGDVLDLARMQARKIALHIELLPLQPLLTHVLRKFSSVTDEIILALHCTASKPTPEADAYRMEQVFTNLIDNAIRHCTAGDTVTVHIHNPNDRTVRIDVIDTGEGIDAEHIPYVFERFYKADTSRARKKNPIHTGGTGLGLAIAQQIIHAHGGTITVSSVRNEQTTFSVTLPLSYADEESSLS